MTFGLLGTAVALSAFAAVTVTVSAAVAVLWRGVASAAGPLPARGRARLLYALRLLPVVLGALAAVALTASAWARYEPRHTSETPGLLLAAAVGLALALLAAAALRGARAFRAGGALARGWTASGTPVRLPGVAVPAFRIAHPWPVVCVVGAVHPRLFVAETVLHACTPGELASVLAHEAGHVAARDNLKRLVAKFLPDAMHWIPAGRALDKAWESASEAAADARAAATRPGGSLDLAAALLRVARLATGGGIELPARALFDGESVAPRVRRLLSEEAAAPASGRAVAVWTALLALPAALLVASFDPSVLRVVHHVAETFVQAR
jgi:Zn-dependent protease with chaperone function